MVHFYDSVPDSLQKWAMEQSVFFIASAPLNGRHVNLSPKGHPSATFHIFDGNHAAYIDTVGSGVETISHIYENGRVTIMFCSFEKTPRIMRFFCWGRVVERRDPTFNDVLSRMGKTIITGTRAIILLDIWKSQTSCGYGVPLFNGEAHAQHLKTAVGECSCFTDRPTLVKAAAQIESKGGMDDFIAKWSARSLDGLSGLREARKMKGEILLIVDATAWLSRHLNHPLAIIFGVVLGVIFTVYTPIVNILPLKINVIHKYTQA
ncbi:hypothetical protein F5884DRAFT_897158 [Xylogone sp. PMI_703]|nr:hypothetical protein F5884DRAFT_897158 [Xylogone sp. PMI_703]